MMDENWRVMEAREFLTALKSRHVKPSDALKAYCPLCFVDAHIDRTRQAMWIRLPCRHPNWKAIVVRRLPGMVEAEDE